MTNYNEIAQNNLDAIMQELAQYTRMAEEIAATVDSLRDILKKHMEENGLEVLTGNEHKATYKTVVSSRIDTAALKKNAPAIAERFTKTTTAKRFTFVLGGEKMLVVLCIIAFPFVLLAELLKMNK